MELFKADYSVFELIPVNVLNDLLEWKFKLEEEKKKQMEESLKDSRQTNDPSQRRYIKK